jgi:von Willebrand factor type A domain
MRVQDLLLLILRCLIVLLLALALARPMLGGWLGSLFASTGVGSSRAVVLLDRSLSMQQIDGASSLFDQAKQSATAIVDGLPVGSTAALWLVDSQVEQVIPEPVGQLSIVSDAISVAQPSDRGTQLAQALDRAMQLGTSDRPVDVFVVTDFQQNAFGPDSAEALALRINQQKSQARVTFVPVGSTDQAVRPNLSVDRVELVDGVATTSRALRLRVTLTNHDQVEAKDVQVRISSRPASSAAAADLTLDQRVVGSIGPGQSTTVVLLARLADVGEHLITASIAGDSLTADDQAGVLVKVKPSFRVGVASLSTSTSASSPTFFVEQALLAMNVGSGDAVQIVRLNANELSIADLTAFDALFVFDRPEIGSNLAQQLLSYVDAGGTLVFVPSPLTTTGLAPAVDVGLLPASVGTLTRDATVPLDAGFLDHPVMSIWKTPESGGISGLAVNQLFTLTPATGATVILRSESSQPLVVERTVGRGYVVQFAFGLDRSASNVPVRPGVFVPMIARLVARGQAISSASLNSPLGTWTTLRLGEVDQSASIQLVSTNTNASVEPLPAPVAVVEGRFVAQTDRAAISGLHRWQRSGQPLGLVNLTRDPVESNTTLLTRQQRSQLTSAGASERTGSTISSQQNGLEFAGLLLVLLLMFTGLEMFLAKRFTPSTLATEAA